MASTSKMELTKHCIRMDGQYAPINRRQLRRWQKGMPLRHVAPNLTEAQWLTLCQSDLAPDFTFYPRKKDSAP